MSNAQFDHWKLCFSHYPFFMHRLALLLAFSFSLDAAPPTGPVTEKRFPPLKLPNGFKATLFACDPLIEYPSVIARGPRPGTLFVAQDYMSGLGKKIIRRSEVKLIEDTDGDGYADKTTLYAGGFNSLQGLCFHRGQVFAMHAPFLTALRDTDGDGKADQRKNLLSGLGLAPEENPVRLHCANGVEAGHDGWLYLSLGDHGVNVKRPEGDRLVFNGGGILRCRTDGADLHIFARGLRNIYDVALDADLNVFTRDNENDGGDYKIRWYHSFHGADHGYPYLCFERPKETQQPMADLGLGSSAGGAAYLETHFPKPWRNSLFFCEWGKSVVSYPLDTNGSSFATKPEAELAVGDDTDKYPFKPTDLIVDYDGTLLVSDWADGQRPKRGRGRIYRIHYGKRPAPPAPLPNPKTPIAQLIALLNNPSHHIRAAAQFALEETSDKSLAALLEHFKKKPLGNLGRLHACWLLPSEDLFKLAETDPSPRVRAQAIRALADRHDPDLVKHKLNAGRGDLKIAERLAQLALGQKPIVQREAIIALGRLRWPQTAEWLRDNLKAPDDALAHAAQQALRRSDNWPAVLKLLDLPDPHPVRPIALRAVAWQTTPLVVDGLLARLKNTKTQSRRRDYAGLLARVYKKPAKWEYWGYRPAPRPAHTVEWKHTADIATALEVALAKADKTIVPKLLRQLQREGVPIPLPTLKALAKRERDGDTVAALLQALARHPAGKIRDELQAIIREPGHADANRREAIALLAKQKDAGQLWLPLAKKVEPGPALAELTERLGWRKDKASEGFIRDQLKSRSPKVRAAAIRALASRGIKAAAREVQARLDDDEASVRLAAVEAVTRLGVASVVDKLLVMATMATMDIRAASLEALNDLNHQSAIEAALANLAHPVTQPAAMRYLELHGGPDQAAAIIDTAKGNPHSSNLRMANAFIDRLAKHPKQGDVIRDAWAKLQGDTGQLLRWMIANQPFDDPTGPTFAVGWSSEGVQEIHPFAISARGTGLEGRIQFRGKAHAGRTFWAAATVFDVRETGELEFAVKATGKYRVWVKSTKEFQRVKPGSLKGPPDRFVVKLKKGRHWIAVDIESAQPPSFQMRFRRRSESASHEALMEQALTTRGSTRRGKDLFFNLEKSLCTRCHRMDNQGGTVGPDLTGVGGRFSRIHLVESILQPSLHIANGYGMVVVILQNDDAVAGVKREETPKTLTLGLLDGKLLTLQKSRIKQVTPTPLSLMPAGMEKLWTRQEFLDLIEYLAGQKNP